MGDVQSIVVERLLTSSQADQRLEGHELLVQQRELAGRASSPTAGVFKRSFNTGFIRCLEGV